MDSVLHKRKENINKIVDDWFDSIKTDRVVVEFSNIYFFIDTLTKNWKKTTENFRKS